MITKDRTTADGNSVHAALFNRARTEYELATGKTLPEINTIADYFAHLGAILEATKDFTLAFLPGDEPYFEVDANSRTISIPSEFQKNGVAVVGDDSAEILVFKIDRYFDATDLYDNKEYYIQWETPAGRNYNKAYERIPNNFIACPYSGDFIIFGWPVHEELTGSAGNITLSVHILQYSEENRENPIYSFNTQPIKLKVNQGSLIEESYENLEADITYSHLKSRLMNTKATGHNSQIKISTPYLLNMSNGLVFDLIDGEATFQVAGYTKAENAEEVFITGDLSYVWNKTGAEEMYIELGDIANAEFFQKYVLVDGEYELYDAQKHGEEVTLYIKVSELTVDKAGVYNVKFVNAYNTFVGESDKVEFTVPGPENIIVEPIVNKVQIIGEEPIELIAVINSNHEKDDLAYSWYKDKAIIENATEATCIATEEGVYNCVITAIRNNESKVGGTENWTLIPKAVIAIENDLPETASARSEINFSVSSNIESPTIKVVWYNKDVEIGTEEITNTNIISYPQNLGLSSNDEISASTQIIQENNNSEIIRTSVCKFTI